MDSTLVRRQSLFLSLPPELILGILARIEYTPAYHNQLRLVCRDFNGLLQQYEHSLAAETVHLHFPLGILAKYPGLHRTGTSIRFKTLDELYMRLCTLFRLERNCHNIRRRQGKEAAWMRPEWMNLQQAGMHLLYRLYDAGILHVPYQLDYQAYARRQAIMKTSRRLSDHCLPRPSPSFCLPFTSAYNNYVSTALGFSFRPHHFSTACYASKSNSAVKSSSSNMAPAS
jgi:hypothetical protein